MTTCFGPYSGQSSGHKMNSLGKMYSEIYKIMSIDLKFNEISLNFYRSKFNEMSLNFYTYEIQRDLVEF